MSSSQLSFLLFLQTELHLLILTHLHLYSIYPLLLTARHFANITPPLHNLKEKLPTVHWDLFFASGDTAGLVDGFDVPWLAIASDVSYCDCWE